MEAECDLLEIFYLQQLDGGDLALYDNGQHMAEISTNGELGPGYFSYHPAPGRHSFELRTLRRAPVRLFGWAADRSRGVTYEALGINGAEAAVIFKWDEKVLASNLEHRNPALIVLAYGTNEASDPNWDRQTMRRCSRRCWRAFANSRRQRPFWRSDHPTDTTALSEYCSPLQR